MHSFHDAPSGINIHHNGDYSGEAKIVIPASVIDKRSLSDLVRLDTRGNLWIDDLIPAAVLVRFAHDAVMQRMIAALENLEPPN